MAQSTTAQKYSDSKPSELLAETERRTQVFQKAVRKTFQFLKQTNRFDDLIVRSIPLENDLGYLVPVCELHTTDPSAIQEFSKWRRDNMFAFPTQFPVTDEGTRDWLRLRLLDVEGRMLFFVVDRLGRRIGHLGFNNAVSSDCSLEIDNVVRGERAASAGIMSAAMRAITQWAQTQLWPKRIYLRVFEDNAHAINFYRKLNYKDEKRIPLRKKQNGESISYVAVTDEDKNPADKYFLQMLYTEATIEKSESMILTAGPSISAREVSYTFHAARSGWNNQWSSYLKGFEESFAQYLGVKHAIATSSCTGALHLSLAALGIGPGDEVIVPDITWVATGNAVLYVGATPIFADVEKDSWCLDPESFKSLIGPRTKAVMPVHLYGHPARMDKIMKIAKDHGLYVIEDAAPSIGAEYLGQKTGTFGDFAGFSFQGAKLMVTGEGGMLVTNNTELYQKMYSIWDQGRKPGTFWIQDKGWKYKMSNVQAAIGLGQLERVDELVEAKRQIFQWYEEFLAGIPGISLNYEIEGARSIYWMSSLVLDEKASISRDALIGELKKRNVDTRPVFPAISQYPIWPRKQAPQPTAHRIGSQAINLPSGVCLTRDKIEYVSKQIRQILC